MFTDNEFPASLKSIGEIDSRLPKNLTFLRPNEFMKKPKLYEDGIEPTDIRQGSLGDCYFLASLASLAEYPKRIQKMIKSCGNGKYEIEYFYDGMKRNIVIDDLLLCKDKEPFFSHNNGDELWVMLLEKAYAKVVGDYGKIEGGIPFLALNDLTGMPVGRINTREIDINKLFKKIYDYDKKKYCMVANVPDVEGIDLEKEYGLVENHAYTVIDAVEIKGNRLLKIRNPWGQCEWKGKWNDKDPNWTPEMKKELNIVDANDGLYFMAIEDFVKFFDEITVVYYKENWKEFNSIDLMMGDKQIVLPFESSGESIFTLTQQRTAKKIALRMWVVDEKNNAIGGQTDATFVISSNIRGKKLKLPTGGKYKLVIETHQSCISQLPYQINISVRSQNEVKFGDVYPVPQNERLSFMMKIDSNTADKCKACGQPLPPKGIAKTKVGSFHLKCFTCDQCGKQLGGKFGLRQNKKLCPECLSKK